MRGPVERFMPIRRTLYDHATAAHDAERIAKARQRELRKFDGQVNLWSQVECIPIPDSNCTEAIRVWYVQAV